METWKIILIIVAVLLIFIASLWYFAYNIGLIYIRWDYTRNFLTFISSLSSKNLSTDLALEQLQIDFSHISSKSKKEQLSELLGQLEYALALIDKKAPKNKIKRLCGESDINDVRDFILALISEIKTNYPYSNLPDRDSELLSDLKCLIETSHNDASNIEAKVILDRIAVEISTKEEKLQREAKKAKAGLITSVIGVALTIAFGIVSIISFVAK